MGKWLARLSILDAENSLGIPSHGTDKAAKRELVSVLAVRREGGTREIPDVRVGAEIASLAEAGASPAVVENGRTCRACAHQAGHRNCKVPVAAGLAPTFCIVWPPEGHAKTCQAFQQKERLP